MTQIEKDLRKVADREKIPIYQNFFKTGKGEYGEGDIFLGVTVPNTREVAVKHKDISLSVVLKSLNSRYHEERLCSLLILVQKYEKGDEKTKKEVVNFYLKNTKKVNGWDLVDLSSYKILGDWLLDKDRKILYKLAKSKNLWEKRIAMITTLAFIKQGEVKDTIKISDILMKDSHDLIHKAVGWMLREAHKKEPKKLEAYIRKNKLKMPRTMLRYAIERYPKKLRKEMMAK